MSPPDVSAARIKEAFLSLGPSAAVALAGLACAMRPLPLALTVPNILCHLREVQDLVVSSFLPGSKHNDLMLKQDSNLYRTVQTKLEGPIGKMIRCGEDLNEHLYERITNGFVGDAVAPTIAF